MYTRKDRSFDGSKIGYTTVLCCQGCAGALFDFYITPLLPHISKKTLEVFKRDYESRKADEEINGLPMFGNSKLDKPM